MSALGSSLDISYSLTIVNNSSQFDETEIKGNRKLQKHETSSFKWSVFFSMRFYVYQRKNVEKRTSNYNKVFSIVRIPNSFFGKRVHFSENLQYRTKLQPSNGRKKGVNIQINSLNLYLSSTPLYHGRADALLVFDKETKRSFAPLVTQCKQKMAELDESHQLIKNEK